MKGIKRLSIVLLASLSLGSCSDKAKSSDKEKIVTDYERLNLKGQVKSIKSQTYYAEGKDSIVEDNRIGKLRLQTFSKAGQIIEEKNFNIGGGLADSVILVYDDENRLLEKKVFDSEKRLTILLQMAYTHNIGSKSFMVMYSYDATGVAKADTLADALLSNFKLNDEGKVTEFNAFFDQENHKVIYEYDDDGNRTKEMYYNAKDSLIQLNELKYNAIGKVIENTEFKMGNPDSIINKTIIEYDEQGNRLHSKWTSNGSVFNEVSTTYYPNGKMKEKDTYTDYAKFRQISKFDEQGREIESLSYKADSLTRKEVKAYDEQGSMVSLKFYNADSLQEAEYIYKYEYDKQGNWVKRVYYKDAKPEDIIIREITYFE